MDDISTGTTGTEKDRWVPFHYIPHKFPFEDGSLFSKFYNGGFTVRVLDAPQAHLSQSAAISSVRPLLYIQGQIKH